MVTLKLKSALGTLRKSSGLLLARVFHLGRRGPCVDLIDEPRRGVHHLLEPRAGLRRRRRRRRGRRPRRRGPRAPELEPSQAGAYSHTPPLLIQTEPFLSLKRETLRPCHHESMSLWIESTTESAYGEPEKWTFEPLFTGSMPSRRKATMPPRGGSGRALRRWRRGSASAATGCAGRPWSSWGPAPGC